MNISQANENLTVLEILESPLLEKAIIAAGKSGLNKVFTWVHVIEVTNCSAYLNGKELILTTGAGWKTKADPVIFINQLIEAGVTALCIQIGEKFNNFRCVDDIPKEMIKAADLNSFPLIIFPENYDCRYVDLMHNLHSMIINKNYKIFIEQENFLNELYTILSKPHDSEDILRFVHAKLNVNVAYLPIRGKALFIPGKSKTEQQNVLAVLNNDGCDSVVALQKDNLSIAYRRINSHQQNLGYFIIFNDKNRLSSFDYLVLEKCSVILAQEFMGTLFAREKERQSRGKWVAKWLAGRLKSQDINQHLQAVEPFIKPSGVAACLVNYQVLSRYQTQLSESMYTISGIARTIFEQQGFFLLWQQDFQSLIYALVDTRSPASWKSRLSEALRQVKELLTYSDLGENKKEAAFYVGNNYLDLNQLNQSLDNAKELYYITEKIGCSDKMFFEDLHVYRIILMLEKNGGVDSFVRDYLGPLLDDNNKPFKNLLNTLIALRDCQYNKIETAKRLYIVRQSLYQRIKKLEALLGDDFITSPEKRICLEIALYGLEFLNRPD